MQHAQRGNKLFLVTAPVGINECTTEWEEPQDILTNSTTIITNIFIFLDTMWTYKHVVDYISFVVQRLNINPYASSVTLLAASNGAIIVPTTNYLSGFYTNWNVTTHSWYLPGFSLPNILSTVRDLVEAVLSSERSSSSMGGQSLIALIVPSPVSYITEKEFTYSMHFMEYLNTSIPDLHFIYYAGGALVRFKDLVRNPNEDLFPLSLDISVPTAADPLVKRIRRVPRRIINPRCGAKWYTSIWGGSQMSQYVRPGAVNYYRMIPNYFFGSVGMSYLKITPVSSVGLTVCSSRTIELPYRNSSANVPGQDCIQVTAIAYSYDLSDACYGYAKIDQCPPLYISVQAQNFGDLSQISCTEAACQTPDQAKYTIYANNLDCSNGSVGLYAQFAMILMVAVAKAVV